MGGNIVNQEFSPLAIGVSRYRSEGINCIKEHRHVWCIHRY
jgi:hypothetical protein